MEESDVDVPRMPDLLELELSELELALRLRPRPRPRPSPPRVFGSALAFLGFGAATDASGNANDPGTAGAAISTAGACGIASDRWALSPGPMVIASAKAA